MTDIKIPIPADLFYKFDAIKFHDDIHKYYLGDRNLISVTTLLHKFEEPFDESYWSEVKSYEYDMTQQDIIDMWNAWNLKSTVKGSAIHNYAELKFNNKVFKFTQEDIDKKLGAKNIEILKTYPIIHADKVASGIIPKMEGYTIMEEYNIVKGYVDNFYKISFGKLIPIKTEFVCYDEAWGLAGMMDIIFWNVTKQRFEIWDWKTNKEFEMTNEFNHKFKPPLHGLLSCHQNMYSLQLSAYKCILERNTGIKIGGMYVVHFNEKNDNFRVIPCYDFSEKINNLMTTQFQKAS